MTDDFETDDMLAAEYAIGLLSGEDLQAARRRAETDPDFAGHIVAWEARLSHMADLDPVFPPDAAKAAVLSRLFPQAAAVPIWRRLGFWQAVTGGALAAVVALAFFALQPRPQDPAGPLYTASITSDTGDFRVVAVVDKTLNEIFLTRTAGAAPPGRILQVWAHGPGEPAQSVGLWPAGETVRLALPSDIAAVQGTLTIGVSEEPPGGSLSGSPSGRVFGTIDIPNVQQNL